jgi:hypothetical protein
MGTEEEIREHEPKCFDNYDRKSCFTCIHKRTKAKNDTWYYECEKGIEIPEGKFFEFCKSYERKEMQNPLKDLFGDVFGF